MQRSEAGVKVQRNLFKLRECVGGNSGRAQLAGWQVGRQAESSGSSRGYRAGGDE